MRASGEGYIRRVQLFVKSTWVPSTLSDGGTNRDLKDSPTTTVSTVTIGEWGSDRERVIEFCRCVWEWLKDRRGGCHAAQSAHSNSACLSTVSVAAACLSGG